MSTTPRHPNKEIRRAISYALEKGWTLEKSGPRAYSWGKLYCGHNQRGGCIKEIWSTPHSPDLTARRIREAVNKCPHTAVGNKE